MAYDLAIIGAGSAAFAAAIHARRKNRRVVMIERGEIGGTCVNVGCIPSKALLAAAEARHSAGLGRFPGIDTTAGPVDMASLTAGKDDIVRGLQRHKYLDLATEYDWEILRGAALPAGTMLSGGLDAGNVADALARTGIGAVDVSSGVETAPGVKDPARIAAFVAAARGGR